MVRTVWPQWPRERLPDAVVVLLESSILPWGREGRVWRASSLPLLICGVLFKRENGGGRIQDKPSEDGGKRGIGWVREDGKWAKDLGVLSRAEGK